MTFSYIYKMIEKKKKAKDWHWIASLLWVANQGGNEDVRDWIVEKLQEDGVDIKQPFVKCFIEDLDGNLWDEVKHLLEVIQNQEIRLPFVCDCCKKTRKVDDMVMLCNCSKSCYKFWICEKCWEKEEESYRENCCILQDECVADREAGIGDDDCGSESSDGTRYDTDSD